MFLSDRKKHGNTNLHYDENVIVAAESPSETVTDTARIIQFFGRFENSRRRDRFAHRATDLNWRATGFYSAAMPRKSYGVAFGLAGGTVCGDKSAFGPRLAAC